MGKSYWSRPIAERNAVHSKHSAEAALYIVCKLLVHLGYFLGLGKCALRPTNCITYLEMEVNSSLQAFQIPVGKKVSFAALREEVFSGSVNIPVKTLQRLMGKAISFSLAFPGAKFFIGEMVWRLVRGSRKLPRRLRKRSFSGGFYMIGLVMFRGGWKNMLRLKSQQKRPNHVGLV